VASICRAPVAQRGDITSALNRRCGPDPIGCEPPPGQRGGGAGERHGDDERRHEQPGDVHGDRTAGCDLRVPDVGRGVTPALFQLTNTYPQPGLTAVTPATGAQGGTVAVILAGSDFAPGATVATNSPGIAVSGVTVNNGGQMSATFTIAANAAPGAAGVTVTTSGGTSNSVTFTVTAPPAVTYLYPTSGAAGTGVTITGTNFGATQGASTVSFNGVAAGAASGWGDTSITVTVPSGASTGNVVVTVGGAASAGVPFTVIPSPTITSIWPAFGPVGTGVTITGSNFGTSQGGSTVTFGGVAASTFPYWSNGSITVLVPAGAVTGNIVVTVNGAPGSGPLFTVTNPPVINRVSPIRKCEPYWLNCWASTQPITPWAG